ncbi:ORF14R [Ictalurid herpesvirus 1]|nr:ORF14L [Ictalurid herpesvirus 1]QAB08575.1 ORF14R [Ictalurid herpesvirus 1]
MAEKLIPSCRGQWFLPVRVLREGFLRAHPVALDPGFKLTIGPLTLTTRVWDWVYAHYNDNAIEWLRGMNPPFWEEACDVLDFLPGVACVSEATFLTLKKKYGSYLHLFVPLRHTRGNIFFGFSPLSATGMAVLKIKTFHGGTQAPDRPGVPMEVYAWETAHFLDAAPKLIEWEVSGTRENRKRAQMVTFSECGLYGSMEGYFYRERATVDICATILADLTGKLLALMRKGIYHGDLKSENIIMMSRSGPGKLIDFEHSHGPGETMTSFWYPDRTFFWNPIGTEAYAPPERSRGRGRNAGVPGIVFQIGLIALNIMVERMERVFVNHTWIKGDEYRAHVLKVIKARGTLDLKGGARTLARVDELIGLVARCLERDPVKRPGLEALMDEFSKI